MGDRWWEKPHWSEMPREKNRPVWMKPWQRSLGEVCGIPVAVDCLMPKNVALFIDSNGNEVGRIDLPATTLDEAHRLAGQERGREDG